MIYLGGCIFDMADLFRNIFRFNILYDVKLVKYDPP